MPKRYSFKDEKPPVAAESQAELVTASAVSLELAQSKAAEANSSLPSGDSESGKLRKQVGLVSGISLIIGTMIGSGIFASASTVAQRSGSIGMMLFVWTGCGVLATAGALCYAELGTMITESGAEYAYLHRAFGPVGAFMFSWTANLVLKPSSLSAICLAFGNYVVEPFYPSETCGSDSAADKSLMAKLLAAFAIGQYVYLNI